AMAFETAFAEGVGCEPNGRLVDEVSARAAAVGHQEAGRSRRGQREEIAQPVCGEEREVDRKHEDALRAASAGDGGRRRDRFIEAAPGWIGDRGHAAPARALEDLGRSARDQCRSGAGINRKAIEGVFKQTLIEARPLRGIEHRTEPRFAFREATHRENGENAVAHRRASENAGSAQTSRASRSRSATFVITVSITTGSIPSARTATASAASLASIIRKSTSPL